MERLSGEIVVAQYKTGKYIGEVLERKEEQHLTLVKVLAVVTHPTQGDLHHPKQTNVALFHQRRALAQFEKAWMPSHTVKPYHDEVPTYIESLQKAINTQIEELELMDSDWAKLSLEQLKGLESEYF